MWKFSVVFLHFAVVAVSFWSVNCLSEEEKSAVMNKIKPLAKDCISNCGLTEADYKKFTEDDDGDVKDPCFKKCFLTETGFLDADVKYNSKELRKAMSKLSENKDEANKVLDQIDSCFEAKGENIGDDERAQMKRVDVLFQCLRDVKH